MKRLVCSIMAALLLITSGLPIPSAEAAPNSWAEDGVALAQSKGYVPDSLLSDYQNPITREEFATLASRVYQRLNGAAAVPSGPNPFTDTDNPDVLLAYQLGIVSGVGGTLFAPERRITRQEICVMLTRTISALRANTSVTPPDGLMFADEDSIAAWAMDAVKYLYSRGIMSGVGENKIAPLSDATREQAILLVLNLANQYPAFELRYDIMAAAVLPQNGTVTILVNNIEEEAGNLIATYDLIERGYLSPEQFEEIKAGKSVSKYGEVFTYGIYDDPDDIYINGMPVAGPHKVNVIYSDCGEFYSWRIEDQKVLLLDYWYDPIIYKTVTSGLKGTVTENTTILLNSLPDGSFNMDDDWMIQYYTGDLDTLKAEGTWSYQNRFVITIQNGQWVEMEQGYKE